MAVDSVTIGAKLRTIRSARGWSMREVAKKAHISLASLSRIENDLQGLDLGLFLKLAKILEVDPSELVSADDGIEADPVRRRIAAMSQPERVNLWRHLAESSRDRRKKKKESIQHLSSQVEELLAQIDYIRAEIEDVRVRLRKRPAR